VAYVALACWVLVELGVRVREAARRQGSPARDRGTRVLIVVALGAAIAIAFAARTDVPSLAMPAALRVVGAVVLWLGLALRAWAIAALGRAFRTTVEVDSGQAVVSTGPYRWIRHPSYTGLLLIVAGIGLALGNWLSLAACLALPIPAFVRRIHVEEAELERVLGDSYRVYEAKTARLIPGLW
jgi:protein-S-isoprenylcysteine O-methyltransferase Ste14